MPDEVAQQQGNGQQEGFNMGDAIRQAFEAINRNPLPDRLDNGLDNETQDQNTTPVDQNSAIDQEQAAPPTVSTSAPDSLQKVVQERDQWKKNYDALQSDIDRRVNKAVEKVSEQFSGQMQALTAALTRMGQPQQLQQPSETDYDQQPISSKQQLQQFIQQEAEKIVQQRLSADPRIAAGGMLGDWARYRSEFQDSPKYDFLVQAFLEEFPAQGNLYETLGKVYKVAQRLEQKALEMANVTGEAARNQSTQPAPGQVQPQSNGRVNVDPLAAARQRAQQYHMEQGVAPTAATKPSIPHDGDLPSAVDALVNNIMRGRR